jgi:hypothetical protein
VGSMENAVVSYLEQTLRTIPVNIGNAEEKEPGNVHENNVFQLGKRETLRTRLIERVRDPGGKPHCRRRQTFCLFLESCS